MAAAVDLSGREFGMYTVLRRAGSRKGKPYWVCQCLCGAEREVRGSALTGGYARSCGCYVKVVQAARLRKHGKYGSPEYKAWCAMKARCESPRTNGYHNYGGRGITVCERWRDSFAAFLKDMGPKPTPFHTVERINVDGNYDPENCRWADAHEQRTNTRQAIWIVYRGRRVNLHQLCHDRGLRYGTVHARLSRGWAAERAIDTPIASPRGTCPVHGVIVVGPAGHGGDTLRCRCGAVESVCPAGTLTRITEGS